MNTLEIFNAKNETSQLLYVCVIACKTFGKNIKSNEIIPFETLNFFVERRSRLGVFIFHFMSQNIVLLYIKF